MSFLKEKSGFNLDAAKVLIEEQYNYAPSVHCSYYGVFQMISHTLNRIGITFDKVAEDIAKSKGRPMSKDSHTYPIDLIHNALSVKYDKYYAKTVRDQIVLLRKFRTISDYKNVKVEKDQSVEAYKISKEVINILNTKL
ncbi:HEPN domain-containing protein [Flavobacterium sangjuense]|uniref:HEPN domain-containing protein n=1 Tax=Flavobacterium sangjuense TaxID=2518177 RepID=UPI00109E349A|nr:HEPN domain-containing protein [Flavobacterium sangjuense]